MGLMVYASLTMNNDVLSLTPKFIVTGIASVTPTRFG